MHLLLQIQVVSQPLVRAYSPPPIMYHIPVKLYTYWVDLLLSYEYSLEPPVWFAMHHADVIIALYWEPEICVEQQIYDPSHVHNAHVVCL